MIKKSGFKPSKIPGLALHLDVTKGITSTEANSPVGSPMDIATPALWLDAGQGITSTEANSPVGSPMDIATPALWLDAALGVTLVGDHVSVWADQSGNLRHASQATDDYRPHLVTNALNGKPVIRFDGTNDTLIGPTTAVLKFPTVFVVAKRTGGTSPCILYDSTDPGSGYGVLYGSTSTKFEFIVKDEGSWGTDYAKGTTETNGYGILSAVRDANCYMNIWTNGGNLIQDIVVGTSNINYGATPQVNIGAAFGSQKFGGDIAEIIIYPSALSDADRKRVELYLAYKYNIATQCGQVSSWADQSTNARHASQATAGYRPAYVTNALNGKPVLRFDGENDILDNTSITGMNTLGAMTIFTVVMFRSQLSHQIPYALISPGGFLMNYQYSAGTTIYYRICNIDNIVNSSKTLSNNVPFLSTMVFDGSLSDNSRFVAYIDGNAENITYTNTPGATLLSITGYSLGFSYYYAPVVDIVEIIIYPTALSDADRKRVELYLAHKYNIATQCGQVSTWADQSANARHALQTTAGYRPAYVTNALNGKPVLRFDGVDDFLESGTITGMNSLTGYTLFAVKSTTDVTDRMSISFTGDEILLQTDSLIREFVYVGRVWNFATIPSQATIHITSVVYDGSQADANRMKYFFNGAPPSTMITTGYPASMGAISGYSIGKLINNIFYHMGDIAEIIIFPSALSTAQINQVNLYLSRKWNIAVALI